MANLSFITSLVLSGIALILVFSAWAVGRKPLPTEDDRKNAAGLQLAAAIFIIFSITAGIVGILYPYLGQAILAIARNSQTKF